MTQSCYLSSAPAGFCRCSGTGSPGKGQRRVLLLGLRIRIMVFISNKRGAVYSQNLRRTYLSMHDLQAFAENVLIVVGPPVRVLGIAF